MALNFTIAPLGLGVTNYTVKWRLLGNTTWNTTNTTPSNPISSSNTAFSIAVPNENSIYEIQITSTCGTSTSQSSIIKKIARECPTLLSSNVSTTDTTISFSIPLSTPAPIVNHISSITVDLYQGMTLISTQVISTPNSINNITFTGLNPSTTYTAKSTITYTNADSIAESSYPNGAASTTQICNLSIQTTSTPVCASVIILSATES